MGNPTKMDDDWVYPHFRKPPYGADQQQKWRLNQEESGAWRIQDFVGSTWEIGGLRVYLG